METVWTVPAPLKPVIVPNEVDDVVVGAGITGLTTAIMLARAGRRVLVLEGRHVGATASGLNTGKASLLQGTKVSRMLGVQSARVVAAYLEGNRRGQRRLVALCAQLGVATESRSAFTYAAEVDEITSVRDEHAAALRMGLPVHWHDQVEAPFEVHAAVELRDQVQLDPGALLEALAREVVALGAVIAEGRRVVGCTWVGVPRVTLEDGSQVRARTVVLATGSPILDRGLYFAKLEPRRSYLLALADAAPPPGMMLSAGTPGLSLRDATIDGRELLLVGGNGHVVGRARSETEHVDLLRDWAARRYPGSSEVAAWSAQDYSSHDGIPYVGLLPRGAGRVYVATGFDKWGLTNAPAAAERIAGAILGQAPRWARPLSRRITRPRSAFSLAVANAKVGIAGTAALLAAESRSVDPRPGVGRGSVGRSGLSPLPLGASGEQGDLPPVVAVCTHLGGILSWNDAEGSWDCPLHGSRFAADGAVLEGPATRALAQHGITRTAATPATDSHR
ncbi:MAG: FAD-dependent oxidoreductase [Marmoricola sp.]|nr:FAD-dependent oxidoreductase [Marmoricola sp.]